MNKIDRAEYDVIISILLKTKKECSVLKVKLTGRYICQQKTSLNAKKLNISVNLFRSVYPVKQFTNVNHVGIAFMISMFIYKYLIRFFVCFLFVCFEAKQFLRRRLYQLLDKDLDENVVDKILIMIIVT